MLYLVCKAPSMITHINLGQVVLELSLSLFLFSATTFGQDIITDRPDQTESSSTVGLGELQIESGVLVGYEEEGHFAQRQLLSPTTLFRYGIASDLELRVLSQHESLSISRSGGTENKPRGMSDIEIGVKIQLFQKESSPTEIAFITHLVIPSGTSALSNDSYESINKLSISHMFTDRMGLGYNLGYNFQDFSDGVFTYSAALGVRVNEHIGIYVEPFGEWQQFETFQFDFDAGFTVLLRENLQVDFSFGTGLTRKMNYLSAGVSWLIPRA